MKRIFRYILAIVLCLSCIPVANAMQSDSKSWGDNKEEGIVSEGDIIPVNESGQKNNTYSLKGKFSVGSYVQLGTYQETDSSARVPLLWRVVGEDENGTLLWLDEGLTDKKPVDTGNSGTNYWEDTSLRTWLNSSEKGADIIYKNGKKPYYINNSSLKGPENGFLHNDNFTNEELKAFKSVEQYTLLSQHNSALFDKGEGDYLIEQNGTRYIRTYQDISYTKEQEAAGQFDHDYKRARKIKNSAEKVFLISFPQLRTIINNRSTLGINYEKLPKGETFLREPIQKGSEQNINTLPGLDSVSKTDLHSSNVLFKAINIRPAFYLSEENSDILSFGNGSKANPYRVVENKKSQYEVNYYANLDENKKLDIENVSETKTINAGDKVTTLPKPDYGIAKIEGWYTDPNFRSRFDPVNDTINGDVSLYARWEIPTILMFGSKYNVFEEGKTVYSNTNKEDSQWYFTYQNNKFNVTLNNAQSRINPFWSTNESGKKKALYYGAYTDTSDYSDITLMYTNSDLNISLKGKNILTADALTGCGAVGIYANGNINIDGDGDLSITAIRRAALNARGSIKINGTIYENGNKYPNFCEPNIFIENGKLTSFQNKDTKNQYRSYFDQIRLDDKDTSRIEDLDSNGNGYVWEPKLDNDGKIISGQLTIKNMYIDVSDYSYSSYAQGRVTKQGCVNISFKESDPDITIHAEGDNYLVQRQPVWTFPDVFPDSYAQIEGRWRGNGIYCQEPLTVSGRKITIYTGSRSVTNSALPIFSMNKDELKSNLNLYGILPADPINGSGKVKYQGKSSLNLGTNGLYYIASIFDAIPKGINNDDKSDEQFLGTIDGKVFPDNHDAIPSASLDLLGEKYTVTANNAKAESVLIDGTTSKNFYANNTVSVNAISPKEGAKFLGWECSDGVMLDNDKAQSTTFIMPNKNVTITAKWSDEGSNAESTTFLYYGRYPNQKITDITGLVENKDYVIANNMDKQKGYFRISPLKWRLIETTDKGIQLMTDEVIDAKQYSDTRIATRDWSESIARSWLNKIPSTSGQSDYSTYYNYAFTDYAFNQNEFSYLLNTTNEAEYTDEKVFLLHKDSKRDDINNSLYFKNKEDRIAKVTDYSSWVKNVPNMTHYWIGTSSYASYQYFPQSISLTTGEVTDRAYHAAALGMRPLTCVDNSKVLFISDADDLRKSAISSNLYSDFSKTNSKKLTMIKNESTKSNSMVASGTYNGTQASISYSNASIGVNKYLSVLIKDSKGVVTYYAPLKEISSENDKNGTVKFTLPKEFDTQKHSIVLFCDEQNGAYETDYADSITPVTLAKQVSYTVTFESHGGSTIPQQTVLENGLVVKPKNPTRVDYTFDGWYKEKEYINKWNFDTDIITSNTILHAKWKRMGAEEISIYYTLRYETNGGEIIEATEHKKDMLVKLDVIPTKDGFIFDGWYADNELTQKISEVTMSESKTVYAKWKANTVNDSPQTGDVSNNPVVLLIVLVSVTVLNKTIFKKKKYNKKNNN